MSFRLKTIFGIAVIEALLLTILVISGLHYLTMSNEEQLLQRGRSTAKLVATMTADAVIAVDLATLDALVDQSLQNEDIVYLRIRNQNGQVLSQGGESQSLQQSFKEDASIAAAESDQRLDISAPVQIGGAHFGQIELGLSTAELETTIAAAFKWMASIALSEMLLVALAGWVLGTYLTRQLHSLMAGASRVASGDFGHQIMVNGKDELAATATSFNHMSDALRRYAELAEEARIKAETGREFAESTLRDALDSMQDGVAIFDHDQNLILMNRAYASYYDLSAENGEALDTAEVLFSAQACYHSEPPEQFVASALDHLSKASANRRWECELTDNRHLLVAQQAMSNGGIVQVQTDVTELYQTMEKNRHLQLELLQRHKTEALGTMASGMAHEINTPVQFISDNIAFVANGISDVCTMMEDLAKTSDQQGPVSKDSLQQIMETADWDFLQEELPQAVKEVQNGTQRIRDQILAFKHFAASDGNSKELVNLKEAIQTALTLSQTEGESKATFSLELPSDDKLAMVSCQRSQINQVIHNLISNALDAIEDANRLDGKITIGLTSYSDSVSVSIQDNGCGIPQDSLSKIFDILYTTKEPGRGTGHGLALCHSIVVRDHGGTLDASSTLGEGSCFTFTLPLDQMGKAA